MLNLNLNAELKKNEKTFMCMVENSKFPLILNLRNLNLNNLQ